MVSSEGQQHHRAEANKKPQRKSDHCHLGAVGHSFTIPTILMALGQISPLFVGGKTDRETGGIIRLVTFKHSRSLRYLVIFALVLWAVMIGMSILERIWWAIPIFTALFAIYFWAYRMEGIVEWAVSDEGLTVTGPNRREMIPWSSITEIRELRGLRTCQIKTGKRVATFFSQDFFPGLKDFLSEVSRLSGCPLPPAIARELGIPTKN